jgi:hypothetical protein
MYGTPSANVPLAKSKESEGLGNGDVGEISLNTDTISLERCQRVYS